ncbi:MAG TPA: hypothetical protein VF748_17700 [Candidatus Acidoferrum sp.]
MKRLVGALAVVVAIAAGIYAQFALGQQQVFVPTRPVGDSSNAAASTQFVAQNAPTTAGTVVPFTQNLTVSSNLGTIGAFGFNPISMGLAATDSASCTCPTPGQNIPTLFTVQESFGGSNINSGRNGLAVNLQQTSATSPTNPYRFYVAGSFLANMQTADNGTGGSPLGNIEAITGQTYLQGTATNIASMTGAELTSAALSGSSVRTRSALTLDTISTDAVHGSTVDTYIWSWNAGTSGFNTWAQIDMQGGTAPLSTAGTLVKVVGSYTATNGIDLGNVTWSGNAFQWGNAAWSLAGNGNATINNLSANNVTTAWSASGFTPAPSCGTGTFTLNSSRFKTIGKTTVLQFDVTLNASGTCTATNQMTFTLPATAQSSGVLPFYNAQNSLPGMCFLVAASATATCVQSAGANYAAATHWLISGVYENQ